MTKSPLSWIISLLLAVWTNLSLAQGDGEVKSVNLRTHSLQMPYLDSDMGSRWWDFGGSTVIRADQYVRLTGSQPSQAGWVFSRIPLTATNWEVEVEFKITGTSSLFGDGMAMWLTKQRGEMGPVFGMKDRFEGLGIFFDTYKNNRPGVVFPYIMAMLGDDNTAYDQANDGKANELAGCSARGLRNADVPTKARVTYYQDKELTVDLMYKKEDEWTRCFQVPNLKLPSVTYLGFSAETGELADNHDIISVTSKNIYSAPGGTYGSAAGSRDYSRNKGPMKSKITHLGGNQSSGWGWFFVKFLMFGGVLALAYVGYTTYRMRQRDRF